MRTQGPVAARDEAILVARILLVALFALSGWGKLTDFPGTVGYMAQLGTPAPSATAVIATAVELLGAIAIALGIWTRPVALLLALFTLGTAILGHPFWTMEGAARYANWINFYKNLSIIAAFLLLYVAGPGRYSVDARIASSA